MALGRLVWLDKLILVVMKSVTFFVSIILGISHTISSACIKLYVYLYLLSTTLESFGKFCSRLHWIQNHLELRHTGINCPPHLHLNSLSVVIIVLSLYLSVNYRLWLFYNTFKISNGPFQSFV
jgi:hypothetical protein